MSGLPNTPLETKVTRAKLRELKTLDGDANARGMDGVQFKQLVENLRADGALTSAPLVYQGTVLSGNHRVQAAIEAGIEEADVIEVLTPLDRHRQLGLQLSHNAIVGKDDPNVLARLYAELDFEWKQYSGLTDSVLGGISELDIKALSATGPVYEELVIAFLPEESEKFLLALKAMEKRLKKGTAIFAGRFEDFDRVFEALVTLKKVKGIHNSAIALRAMADLALATLESEMTEKPDEVL